MDMRWTRAVWALILIAMVAAAIAGCSGGPVASTVAEVSTAPTVVPTLAPTATPQPTTSPEPTSTPEPTPDLAAIGAAYLVIADIFATKGQPAVDAIAKGGSYTPDEWGDMHQKLADVYDEVLVELDGIEFPAELADEVRELRAKFVDTRELFAEVVADPSTDNWDQFIETATAYGVISDGIRAYLGLPPRPTAAPD